MHPIKVFAAILIIAGSGKAISAPTLQLITPTPTDGWLVTSPQGNYSESLELAIQATDTDVSATTFWAGVMYEGTCQSLKRDPADVRFQAAVTYPAGIIRADGVLEYTPIPPNTVPNPSSSFVVRAKLPIAVERTASGPLLTLCAYNSTSNSLSTIPVRVSYGQPAKSVLIQRATYSSSRESLAVQGRVVPNGRNILTGTSVIILDVNGNNLGSGSVVGKGFNVILDAKGNPGRIMAKVVNSVSVKKSVVTVR